MTDRRNENQGTILSQYKALLIRNLIIKKRERRKTFTEFFMPLYCIFILAVIRVFVQDTVYEEITQPHDGTYLEYNTSLVLLENVFVAPNTSEVHDLISEILEYTGVSPDNLTYFASEDDLLEYYKEDKSVYVALIFDDDPVKNPTYKIRINPKYFHLVLPTTLMTSDSECRATVTDDLEDGYSCPPNSYYSSGFLPLQTSIDFSIAKLILNQSIPPAHIFLQSFPRDEYMSGGTVALRSVVPLYMVFAWAQFIIYMMILIVEEKEKKIKEGMKMMGLQGFVYWLSWVTIYFGYVIILALICIIVLPLAQVFRYANLVLLFILFVLYGLSSIILALMFTPFFNKAKMAGIVGQLIQVLMSLLFYLQVYLSDTISSLTFWFLGLLSPCAFSLAIDKAIYFDFAADGLNWDNIWEGDGLPFAGSLIMISVDIVIYLLLALYFDNVIPSEYGTKRKPWFIFQKSTYVKRSKANSAESERLSSGNSNSSFEPEEEEEFNPDIEPFPAEFRGKEAVRIRNLHKVFKCRGKEDVHAVDGISMDIYEGQITAILGHNGAGKTTLFNLLTGMIAPSRGKATIFGYDISDINDLAEIRRLTGVCPQHDILFLNLTPREHLKFYAVIKGMSPDDIDDKVIEMLQETDLMSKADTKAEDLSGGQKRKLSIGIALIGDPKIVFLDEPTAGVDAYSRRRLWTLLKKKKENSVILLTTHFMDEADILADRKAIVSKGKLRCYGTSMFLKNKFGLGYHLTLVISDSIGASTGSVEQLIRSVIPNAEAVRHFGKELSFILPSSSAPLFTDLFRKLDDNIADLGTASKIESYGISMTTLEEVFLSLNEEQVEDKAIGSIDNLAHEIIRARSPSVSSKSSLTNSPEMNGETPNVEGFQFNDIEIEKDKWRAFKALIILRFTNMWREIAAVIFLVVFPLGFVAGSIALANGMSIEFANDDPILLNPDVYYSSDFKRVLLNNETGDDLPSLESVFSEVGMEPKPYNGSYGYLFDSRPHFSSFDIFQYFQNGWFNFTLRYNTSFTHSLPILINIMTNSILRELSMGSSEDESNGVTIQTYSQQLPLIESGTTEFDFSSYFSPVMIGFVFTMIPSGLVIDIVYDREINGRNILRLNGVTFDQYFTSFYSVISVPYLISYIGLLVIVQAFQVPSLVEPGAFASLAILYFVYMPGTLLFSGCVSYAFDKQETARQFYPSISTTLGFALYTVVSLVDIFNGEDVSLPIHIVFTILVNYYIPFGVLYYVNKVYITCSLDSTCGELNFSDYMTTEIVIMLVVCIVDIFFYYVLLRVIDTVKLGGSFKDALWMKGKVSDTPGKEDVQPLVHGDDDVIEERERIFTSLNAPSYSSTALLCNVGKIYNPEKKNSCKQNGGKTSKEFTAVKSVSFEVHPGEVFGLLGPNGAGKTSTLRIMTAEEAPTRGKVTICDYNITSSLSSAYEHLGYCPQHDTLWKNITVEEHIECFANISGIRKDQVKSVIDAYVKGLEIEEHRKKKSKNCSGGTKRKLSYILSMMGRPKIVLLDEPSTGMDPQSKRFLWNSILASFKGDRCALLTTHSMEEADALCSRIGILVKGELRCLGSVQHLKNKYGSGYSLEFKLNSSVSGAGGESRGNETSSDLHTYLKDLVKEKFPNSAVDEEFEERIIIKIPQRDITSLAQVFKMLEELKRSQKIEEYALSQTTLEQVFLRFARLQEDLDDDDEDDDEETKLKSSSVP